MSGGGLATRDRPIKQGYLRSGAFHGIAGRFWLLVTSLLTIVLVAGGGIEGWFTYVDSVEAAQRLQQSEARAAAIRISEYLRGIEVQVAEVARLPWSTGALGLVDRQEEYHRLLKLVPSITQLRAVDRSGKEQLFVARTAVDRLGSMKDLSADQVRIAAQQKPIYYAPVRFTSGLQPSGSLAIREGATPPHAVTIVDLDLAFITEVVQAIKVGRDGKAYVTDSANRLVAHPNTSLVLRNTDLSRSDYVRSTRAMVDSGRSERLESGWGKSPEGDDVLVSAVHIPGPDWIVFVEQSTSEALGPVRAALFRTLLLIVVGFVLATSASLMLARRLTRPVLDLRDGAVRIAGGDLAARIDVSTGDEVESLAREFNRMAGKLQESYATLEEKVRTRTADLEEASAQVERQSAELRMLNQQLHERLHELDLRRDEAERANAAKTRFLAAASHDLRQPMHAISLLVGILTERIRATAHGELAGKVYESVQAMEALFSSLLDISKLDAGIVKPVVTEFAMTSIFRTVELNYAPLAQEKGLSLELVTSGVVVRSDRILLERIIGNLVSNAIRYTERGRVIVGCRRRADNVCIAVIDTGIGIPSDHLDDVFEEFVQLANPERDRGKGLGLGLSIVKRSADLLGHRIVVRSRAGAGSLFAVVVERGAAPTPERDEPRALPAGSRDIASAFVLIVEDDRASRYAMASTYRDWGCQVIEAEDVDGALSELGRHLRAPDLIVSDYRLRGPTTGVGTIERIRAFAEMPIPAILVTGDVATAAAEALAQGNVRILNKPVSPTTLRETSLALLGD